ncbi:uncharacterized protein [Dysidea avara]|uniref:uncharacterized protein n=1 Tax=Dysidea avara TaxID=196820 RepID=UPI00331EE6AB
MDENNSDDNNTIIACDFTNETMKMTTMDHSSDHEDNYVESTMKVDITTGDKISSDLSFGPHDEGYTSMMDCVEQVELSEQLQLFKDGFKQTVVNQMNGLDEMFKTVGEVVDTLDEEYYLMGEKKSFVSDSEVNWNDQLQTSQQQLQSFKQELNKWYEIIGKMVDDLEEKHQLILMEERKDFEEILMVQIQEKENE